LFSPCDIFGKSLKLIATDRRQSREAIGYDRFEFRKGFAMHRNFTPKLEGLERKQLMSAQPLPASTVIPVSTVAPPMFSTPPFVRGPGQPLPLEIARERYASSFVGPFTVGPPLFTGESSRITIRGLGFSTQFAHGDLQMTIVLPNTPGAPIFGGAFIEDKNITGGNEIGLDIVFDPTSLDARGRPTLGSWSTDPNIYSGPDFVALGTGTVYIRYVKNSAYAVFQGNMYTNGLTNPLGNASLRV
jgi:hypothetical protein